MRLDLLVLFLALAAILFWIGRRDQRRSKAGRAAFFADCLPLFESVRLKQDGIDYPILTGLYRGRRVTLRPLADGMALRKLPSLWLLVTLREPLPWPATLDILERPLNSEYFSPSNDLEYRVEAPPGWSETAVARSDDPDALPSLEPLAPHAAFFQERGAKELLVTPRGLRIVWQLAEAERSNYLLLRQAVFSVETLPRDLAIRLLDEALALEESLQRQAAPLTQSPLPQSLTA